MPEQYPKHLVPTSQLPIISNEALNKSEHIAVWVKADVRLKDDDGKLNASAVNVDRIPRFSTNKIPHSVPLDLKIEFDAAVKDIYLTDWEEGQDGVIPSDNEFNYIYDRQLYFLKISEIEHKGEYFNPYNYYDKSFEYNLTIVHKPLVANYWHFEFNINTGHGYIDRNKNRWINELCGSIRAQIVNWATFELN